jgi:hypothetical protein
VRCGEKRRAGVPPVEATSGGSPRYSNWRRAETQSILCVWCLGVRLLFAWDIYAV